MIVEQILLIRTFGNVGRTIRRMHLLILRGQYESVPNQNLYRILRALLILSQLIVRLIMTVSSLKTLMSGKSDLDSIEVVHSQYCASLVFVTQKAKSFWFSSFLVSHQIYVHNFPISIHKCQINVRKQWSK